MTREQAERWFSEPCPGGDGHEGSPAAHESLRLHRGSCGACILDALTASPAPLTPEDQAAIRAAAAPGATREQVWTGACAAQRAVPGAAPHYPWPASPAQGEAGRLDGTFYKRCPLCHKKTSPAQKPLPRRQADREKMARTVACPKPKCGSAPGIACRDPFTGNRDGGGYHLERLAVARAPSPAPEPRPEPGADARALPDGTLVTCEHCRFPHPKGDDGRPCLFPKVAPAAPPSEKDERGRIEWKPETIGRGVRGTCSACGAVWSYVKEGGHEHATIPGLHSAVCPGQRPRTPGGGEGRKP